MAQLLDSATRQALLDRVRFYRDLGLTEFYRRPVGSALLHPTDEDLPVHPNKQKSLVGDPESVGTPELAAKLTAKQDEPQTEPTPLLFQLPESQEIPTITPRKSSFPAAPAIAAAVPAAERAAAMQLIREELGECTRCALHKGRNKLVFGDGSPVARLMFVGEGPGADEDSQGLPFVGKAGQLLNNMIAAMGLKREEVYIANVVKCRPPNNRVPEPEEGATCSPFLFRQIDVVRPEVLVALGATAATWLLGTRQPLAGLRGRVHSVRGTKLIVTYHPAYLLRDPRQKKEAWADLQIAMKELGLKLPSRS